MNCSRCGQSFEDTGPYCEKCTQAIARNRKTNKQKRMTMNLTRAKHVTTGVARTTKVPEDVWIGKRGHMFKWGSWLLLPAIPMILTLGVLYFLIDVWEVMDLPNKTTWPLMLVFGYLMLVVPVGVALALLGIGADVIQRGWKRLSKPAKWGLGLGLGVTVIVLISVCLPDPEDEASSEKEAQFQSETFSAPGVFTIQEARSRGLLTQEDEQYAALWRERDIHWDRLKAMDGVIEKVLADEVTSSEEADLLCIAAPQWSSQLDGVVAYTQRLEDVNKAEANVLFAAAEQRQEAVIELQNICAETR